MPFVTAAVAIVGVLCAVDLLLTYGVIRRLREHTRILAAPGAGPGMVAAPGSTVGEFTATDHASAPLSPATFTEPTLVGFFTPGCGPCEALLPRFTNAARRWREQSRQVVEVVAPGAGDEAYVGRLAPVARVVGGADAGALAEAFAVRGYPVVCLVDSGVVLDDRVDLDRLSDAVRR